MPRADREQLIRKIEELRRSRVLAYICSDRPGAAAQIGEDAVRPMYDHVRQIGHVERIDLYLYSRGGAVEVPWRIVSMLREHCDRLGVLIPYRAQSAATLMALGCDQVVMGAKAELGPIDPAFSFVKNESGTAVQEEIRVEDVMAYVEFLREKASLTDAAGLAANVRVLPEKLAPWTIGSIYRTHAHIRAVARKMLSTHKDRVEDERIDAIVETLAEKIYSHGHAIARTEAEQLGLRVVRPSEDLEDAMWRLLEAYEAMMKMRQPLDHDTILGPAADEAEEMVTLAAIESVPSTWAFQGTLRLRRVRGAPASVNINLNLGVQLPPGIDPAAVPQEIVNQLVQQVQQRVPDIVTEQTRRQSPVLRTEGGLQGGAWKDVTTEGI